MEKTICCERGEQCRKTRWYMQEGLICEYLLARAHKHAWAVPEMWDRLIAEKGQWSPAEIASVCSELGIKEGTLAPPGPEHWHESASGRVRWRVSSFCPTWVYIQIRRPGGVCLEASVRFQARTYIHDPYVGAPDDTHDVELVHVEVPDADRTYGYSHLGHLYDAIFRPRIAAQLAQAGLEMKAAVAAVDRLRLRSHVPHQRHIDALAHALTALQIDEETARTAIKDAVHKRLRCPAFAAAYEVEMNDDLAQVEAAIRDLADAAQEAHA